MPYLSILVTLIPAYLVSRLLLFLVSWWNGGVPRLVAAHAMTLLLFVVIAGYFAPTEPDTGDWQARIALILLGGCAVLDHVRACASDRVYRRLATLSV